MNKIKNRIRFKIKIKHYLELLMPETMKLLKSTKSKVIKSEKGENVLIYKLLKQFYFIVTLPAIIISMIQDFCILLFLTNLLVNLQMFCLKVGYLKKLLTPDFHD